jgi:hypothetical protein
MGRKYKIRAGKIVKIIFLHKVGKFGKNMQIILYGVFFFRAVGYAFLIAKHSGHVRQIILVIPHFNYNTGSNRFIYKQINNKQTFIQLSTLWATERLSEIALKKSRLCYNLEQTHTLKNYSKYNLFLLTVENDILMRFFLFLKTDVIEN